MLTTVPSVLVGQVCKGQLQLESISEVRSGTGSKTKLSDGTEMRREEALGVV